MWVIATEDLGYYLPWSGRSGGHTSVDIAKMGTPGNVPRLFSDELSAKLALGHWLSGPYEGHYDEAGWYPVQVTDPNRREEWEGKLKARKVTIV